MDGDYPAEIRRGTKKPSEGDEKGDCQDEGSHREGERLQECLGRRRTGPQQYTTEEGAGWGAKTRTDRSSILNLSTMI